MERKKKIWPMSKEQREKRRGKKGEKGEAREATAADVSAPVAGAAGRRSAAPRSAPEEGHTLLAKIHTAAGLSAARGCQHAYHHQQLQRH